MHTQVGLIPCETYDPAVLKRAIVKAVSLSGFDFEMLRGKKVLLKPNLLMPIDPGRAVTTHPAFFEVVAELVLAQSPDVWVIDSPNFFSLAHALKKTGLMDVAQKLRLGIPDNAGTRTLHWDGARRYKTHEVSAVFFEADAVINLPKLKSHSLTYLTGAVKNLFGAIPGTKKAQMHMKVPDPREFSEYLLDLYGSFLHGFEKPKIFLHLMDAVVGLEGEGPGPSGKPKQVGAVIAGTDAIGVDWTAAKLVNFDIQKIFTITQGFLRGYGPADDREIRIEGESIERIKVSDFVPSKTSFLKSRFWKAITPALKNIFVERPIPVEAKCTRCFYCMKVCPAGAITKRSERAMPLFNSRKCIRCFCCLETCPGEAIVLKRGLLQWRK